MVILIRFLFDMNCNSRFICLFIGNFIFSYFLAERKSRRGHRDHSSNRGYDQYDSASMMSSDLETTSFVDSEEESQMSSATESSRYIGGQKRRRRRRQRMPRVERVSMPAVVFIFFFVIVVTLYCFV